ncbi:MAG: histone deacetylase family protein, partial [Pseudomonadota bacterium]
MRTIYSERHHLRDAKTELYGGELVQPFESPSRAHMIVKAIQRFELGAIEPADSFSLDPVLAVHDA